MTPDQIRQANSLLNDLRRAEEAVEAVSKENVTGIIVAAGAINRIVLERGGGGGTGTITSLGYPPELEAWMTSAWRSFYDKRASEAKAALAEMGIEEAA